MYIPSFAYVPDWSRGCARGVKPETGCNVTNPLIRSVYQTELGTKFELKIVDLRSCTPNYEFVPKKLYDIYLTQDS
jgi:hypothetical protein